MPPVEVCPSVADYRKMLSGEAPPDAVAGLAGHLETCDRCAATIHSLLKDDSLSDSVRASGAAPALGHLPPDIVSKLLSLSDVPMAAPAADTQVTNDGGAARAVRLGEHTVQVSPGMTAPQAPGELGRLGGYRVLEVLGEGGMGLVYRAEDVQLQRLVALKVMKADLARNDNSRKRFLAEARAAAKVRSDHVVTIFQTGEDGGTAFAAMELLRGEPLDHWLRTHRDPPLGELMRIGRETALGLHAAHEEGLIHRDIKPANIWIESSGRVKILDFGLARSVEADVHLTNSGAVVGTPAYMAPEQAAGHKVDHRADLFSLGCVLHRMATGQLPFKGDTVMSILTALAVETPPPAHELNPAVPRRLSDVIARLLAKTPAGRPPTALAVADELKAILAVEVALREPSTANYVPQAVAVVLPLPDEANSQFDFSGDTAVVSPRGSGAVARGAAEPDDESDDDLPPVRRPAARSRKPLVLVAVAVLAVVVLTVAASQLIFNTKDGTLVVEVDDAADVRFKNGKLEVYDSAGKLKYTLEPSDKNKALPPGKYLVKVVGADGVKLETDTFEIASNGKTSVRVKASGPVLAKKDPPGNEPKKDVPLANAWKPSPEQQAFVTAVAALPANERAAAVLRKMNELNPVGLSERPPVGFELDPKDGEPTSCRVTSPITFEGWPLAALTSLKKIDLTETHILDFRPLASLPLEEIQLKLILDNTASEAALKGIPTLKTINGIAAKDFWAERATVRADIEKMTGKVGALSPEDQSIWLRSTMKRLHPKLQAGDFHGTHVVKDEQGLLKFWGHQVPEGVYDFSPVRALPIEVFETLGGNLFDITPLKDCKKMKIAGFGGQCYVRDLSPLAGLPLEKLSAGGWARDLSPLKGMRLKELAYTGTPDSDLSPLEGMPLEVLYLGGAKNLAPLAGLPLKRLVSGHYSPIADLSPLRGMPLETLILHRPQVTDFSPLAGMPLKEFDVLDPLVADFSPLKGMPLAHLKLHRGIVDPVLATLPLKSLDLRLRLHSESEEKVLRSLKLESINGMKPDDFWKDVEKRRKEDADKTAEMAKVPLEVAALEKALWICGQYPKVKLENGVVAEVAAGHANGGLDNPFAVLLAFPKVRKLALESGGDYSALSKLTEVEEFNCPPLEVFFNRLTLMKMPKLKTINGKPAKDVLGEK